MKRIGRLIIIVVCFAIIALVAYGMFLQKYIGPVIERQIARHSFPKATAAELEDAVGDLGAVFHFHDGSWIAVRYNDSHSMAPWSFAIALDSGGLWFESTEHFCGAFKANRDERDMIVIATIDAKVGTASEPPDNQPQHRGEWVRLLATSPDLATARQRMARYFHQVD